MSNHGEGRIIFNRQRRNNLQDLQDFVRQRRTGEYQDLLKMNNLWNIFPSILTLVAGGGWLFDRRRHRQEVESLRADNRQKDMNLSKMYVDEFKENIADPLRHEVRELRTEITHLRNAIQKINDCPHSDACPVYSELQKQQDRHAADPQ